MIDCGARDSKKECLQTDLDELAQSISRLEDIVEKFSFDNPKKESGIQVSPPKPLIDILRLRIQAQSARVREVTNILENELSKIG